MPSTAVAPSRLPAPIVAALSLAVATGLYGGMGALVKLMGERYSIGELVFYRGFFATLVLLALAPGRGGWGVFRTSRPAGHAMRALAGLGGMSLTFAALTLLPLAEAAALGFAAPLLTTALAGPLLGERVGPWRWAAIAIGLGGVLIIVQPGSSAFSWGAPLALAGAFCGALAMLSIRRLGGTESGLTITLYYQLFCAAMGALSLLRHPTLPTGPDLIGLIGIGILGGFAQLFMTRAYMMAPASFVAPFEYTAILWSVSLGLLIWGDVPTLAVYLGAALVVAAGLVVARTR